jgi:hypothetical protein
LSKFRNEEVELMHKRKMLLITSVFLMLLTAVIVGSTHIVLASRAVEVPTPTLTSSVSGSTNPKLTDEQIGSAVDIAFHDVRIKDLTDGRPYDLGAVGAISDGQHVMGALLHIVFDKPYTIAYEWPMASATSTFEENTYYASVSVRTLGILIDLDAAEVVGIRPMSNAVGKIERGEQTW